MNEENNTAALAAFEAGFRSASPQTIGGITTLISHHKDVTQTDVSHAIEQHRRKYEKGPKNLKATANVTNVEEFIAHVLANEEERTQVYADPHGHSFVAFYDFNASDSGETGWGQHLAGIQLTQSRKLKEWLTIREWQTQEEFANFLEDHIEDISEPNGNELLEIAKDLTANRDASFTGKTNLENGDTTFNYQDKTTTSVTVPSKISLAIPIFQFGKRFKLNLRLRYRVSSSGVSFKVLFSNLDDSIEAHFSDMVNEIQAKINSPVYKGSLQVG